MPANSKNSLSFPKDITSLLEQNAPVFSMEELHDFVKNFFHRKEDFLACMPENKVPFYLLESRVLKERSMEFKKAFCGRLDSVDFYFAVKSNNHPDVARILLLTGFGLDVSSGLELRMAIDLDAQNIVFSGPGKTDTELTLAVKESDRLIVLIDSFNELVRLEKHAAKQNKIVRVGIRLNTNPEGLWRKFGIIPNELNQFWEIASRSTHLEFQGLQFHSSWNLTPQSQVNYIQSMGEIIKKLPKPGQQQIKFLDIGGGYWPPQGEWLQESGTTAGIRRKALGLNPGRNKKHYRLPALSIDSFAEQLSQAINDYIKPVVPSCNIFCEPGRWLCNDAMHLLFSVVDKKAEDLVITDAGTNAVGWERFETDYFPVLNLSRPALDEKQCDILGSLCTPHDVWGYNYWGEDIQVGDILMIPCQGAYTYSLRQNFIKPLPEVVII